MSTFYVTGTLVQKREKGTINDNRFCKIDTQNEKSDTRDTCG